MNIPRVIIAIQLVIITAFIAVAIWVLCRALTICSTYYAPELAPIMVKTMWALIIAALVMTAAGAYLASKNAVTFYNSYWDLFGSLLIFIVPWAILRAYNMHNGYVTGSQAQFGLYLAMTMIASIIYQGAQTIRYNHRSFYEIGNIIASLFVFMSRIVVGYVAPVIFIITLMPGSGQQKDEKYSDYQLRSAINAAEKIALAGFTIFWLSKLVNGKRMQNEFMSKEEAEMWEEVRRSNTEYVAKNR